MSPGWNRSAVVAGLQGRKAAWQAAVLALLLDSAGVSMADPARVDLDRAALRGDVESVRLALTDEAAGQDIPVKSKNNALGSAIASFTEHATESKQIIELLLEHGANVNAPFRSVDRPLYYIRGPEVLQFLLDIGADPKADNNFMLGVACNPKVKDPVRIFTLLLDHGAQISSWRETYGFVLDCAVRTQRLDLEEFLLTRGFSPDFGDSSKRTALFDAADAAAIDLLLQHGANIEAVDEHGWTPLADAIENTSIPKSLLLLARGANANALARVPQWGVSVLQVAAENGQLDVVSALVARGANVNARARSGVMPLEAAIRGEQVAVVDFLLAHGADVEAATGDTILATRVACNANIKDPIRMLTMLLDHGMQLTNMPEQKRNVLQCAVLAHSLDLEEFLLAHGVSADLRDVRGRTALFDATDAATIDPLLRRGADIEAVDSGHVTALADAIYQNEVSKSLLLLARGANVNALVGNPQGKRSVLSIAAAYGQLQVVSELVARGARINTSDRSGVMAINAAISGNQLAVAEFLLAHGADVNVKGENGWSPLHYAASLNNGAMVSLLLSQHADATARDNRGLLPERLATSEDVAALFAREGTPVEPQSPTAADAAACAQVVRSGLWKGIRGDEAGSETQNVIPDPRDNWYFQGGALEQDIQERVIRIRGQDYVLGVWSGKPHWVFVDDYPSGPTPPDVQARIDYEVSHPKEKKGPVYLARLGADGVASIVCEYKGTWHGWFNQSRVMTPLERLQVLARKEALTLSEEAVKVAGLWAVQALSEVSPRSGIGSSSLNLDARARFLEDAIQAHRDDILRFYLDHSMNLDAAFVKYPSGHTRDEASERLGTAEWTGDVLYAAIAYGTPDSVRLLLEHGVDPLLQFDRKCDLHLTGPHTHAGWLSYVLSEQTRALCVIDALRGWQALGPQ